MKIPLIRVIIIYMVTITASNLTIRFISLSFNISDQYFFNISSIFLTDVLQIIFFSCF